MKDYEKYRWFVTSSGKFVIGGKNAEQNEELMNNVKEKDTIIHTASSGSPFCIIKNPSEKELKEVAVFCACFSQDWKRGKKKTQVDIFRGEKVFKDKKMKIGTFGVLGKVKKKKVELRLWFKKQKGKLRGVPFKTGKLSIVPGKVKKEKIVEILVEKLKVGKEEVNRALPAGGIKIIE